MSASTVPNPEIGQSLVANGIVTNYHDVGTGSPVLLLHGSGPGVSAWANWRVPIQGLSESFRLVAPDQIGFGFTQPPEGHEYSFDSWLAHVVAFLDELGLDQVDVIGNSFGGAMALGLTIKHPERVRRVVFMGTTGVTFDLTPGLDAVWGYTPSAENMRGVMEYFAYDHGLVGDDLVEMRHQASLRPGVQESFAAMFPAPRQRWIDAMSYPEEQIRAITQPALIVHGRDDRVIPPSTSFALNQWIDDSELHIFGRCGHWTQIERSAEFVDLVTSFLHRGSASS